MAPYALGADGVGDGGGPDRRDRSPGPVIGPAGTAPTGAAR